MNLAPIATRLPTTPDEIRHLPDNLVEKRHCVSQGIVRARFRDLPDGVPSGARVRDPVGRIHLDDRLHGHRRQPMAGVDPKGELDEGRSYRRVPTARRYSFSKRAGDEVPWLHLSQNASSAASNSVSRPFRAAFACAARVGP
jgi:hypothetical protein